MDGIINVRVNGYSIVKDNNCAGAQFEANSTRMRIEFSRDWDGFVKTVTFWDALGRNPVKVILDESLLEDKGKSERVYLVPIAGEAMTEAGVFPFTIDGYDDGVRKRTVEEKLKVLPSRKEDHAGDPQEPTPTQAEQLQKEIAAIQTGKADKTEIPTNIDGLLRENESIVWCGNTDPQDIGYSIWLDKQIIKVQDSNGNWVDAMAGKAEITWIDIEVGASATDLKGSSGYPEELDTITDDGFYGIRIYEVLHGGEGGNEEIHSPLYNEYLMVSKGESGIAQMYIDADKGIRIRNGKKNSGGTITWEPWNQQFVDKTTEQTIDGHKFFMQEIAVPSVGGINPELTINGAYSLNLTANSGNVNINANNGNGNVNINGNLNSKEIQELTTRVTTLEAVNADLQNIIALQQSYIGGDKA